MSLYDDIVVNGSRNLEKKVENVPLPTKEPQCNYHYVNGCFLELLNYPEDKYAVHFINADTGTLVHIAEINGNSWAKCNYSYFINWRIVIYHEKEIIDTINMDLKGERVLINLESSSLGDTLAWMPYAEEFKKKHGCKVILSTFMNFLFEDTYPDLEFVEPGTTVEDIRGMYNIGWFYNGGNIDLYRNPRDFRKQPMQKTATDILGLEYIELKPRLLLVDVPKDNTVGIGFHSTAQAKYWNNPTGWKDVINYINSLDMVPLLLSREGLEYMGNKVPRGAEVLPPGNINQLIGALCKCKLYVGIGSGISWLAWACNVPTILISGFSEPYTEMQPSEDVIRISTPKIPGVTHGCFNKYKFDPSKWDWYEPAQLAGTNRMYECSKTIESKVVIDAIDELLNPKKEEKVVKAVAKKKTPVKKKATA